MTRLPANAASHLQNSVFLLTLDDYSPHGLIGRLTSENWQLAVDTIYRCLRSGIWAIWNDGPLVGSCLNEKHVSLCEKLAVLSPFDLSEEGESYWLDVSLCATDISRGIIAAFNIAEMSSHASESLIKSVEGLYVAHGVSLSEGILFPVRAP